MTQRRLLGLWLPLAVVAALPMCEPSEPNESSAAAGGGGEGARAVAGETSVIPGAAWRMIRRAVAWVAFPSHRFRPAQVR